jgi:Fe-S oxidoreductase
MGLFGKQKKDGATLYFPGCLATAKLPGIVEAQQALLRDLGVEFVTLPMECCGYAAWYAGHEEEFQAIKGRNKRKLEEHGITTILTGCPHCARTFKEKYRIETRHLLTVYEEHIEKIKLKEGVSANYHHPCFLDKLGVDEKTAVRVLRRAGVHTPTENVTRGCCGSVGDDFSRNNPEEARLICQRRCSQFGEKTVVTACPYCIVTFQQQRKEAKDVAEVLWE